MTSVNARSVVARKLDNARAIFKQLTGLLNDPKYSTSYYPQEVHKSKWAIFRDNVMWWLKYREVNNFYYVYGLDKKTPDAEREVLPYKEFRMIRDRRNQHVAGQNFNYVCLLRDKFIFGQLLASLGAKTPENIALLSNERVTWLATGKEVSIDDIITSSRADVDGFCKQLAGLCGEGAFPLKIENGKLYSGSNELTTTDLREKIKGQYLFQKRIRQHPEMARLHPQSVNTVRVITFNNNGKVELFSATLRIGSGNKSVDNWASGGIIVGVDPQTATLHKYGIFKPGYGGRVEEHPDTKVKFEGYEIPFLREGIQEACRLHRLLYGIHSVGWDVAITEQGPVFIEGNDDWDGAIPMSVEKNFKTRFLNMFSRNE